MQLEAIYRDGQLQFSQPVHFRHQSFRVVVEVPEEEILDGASAMVLDVPPEIRQHANRMRERLDQIRSLPQSHDAQLPPLSEKTIERIEAFKQREER